MVPWSDFARAVPELAAFGAERMMAAPAYFATVAADGLPRVHPVTTIVAPRGLYVFMEPTSPKGRDLRERRGYAIHNGVPDMNGTGGEFFLRGEGVPVDDVAERADVIAESTYEPADRYILFELLVSSARANGYGDVALPDPARWTAAG